MRRGPHCRADHARHVLARNGPRSSGRRAAAVALCTSSGSYGQRPSELAERAREDAKPSGEGVRRNLSMALAAVGHHSAEPPTFSTRPLSLAIDPPCDEGHSQAVPSPSRSSLKWSSPTTVIGPATYLGPSGCRLRTRSRRHWGLDTRPCSLDRMRLGWAGLLQPHGDALLLPTGVAPPPSRRRLSPA